MVAMQGHSGNCVQSHPFVRYVVRIRALDSGNYCGA